MTLPAHVVSPLIRDNVLSSKVGSPFHVRRRAVAIRAGSGSQSRVCVRMLALCVGRLYCCILDACHVESQHPAGVPVVTDKSHHATPLHFPLHCTAASAAAAGLRGLPNHYDYEWLPDAFGAAAALGSAAFGTAPFEAPKEPAAEHRQNLSASAAGRRWSPGRFVRVFSCSVFCTGLGHAETAASMLHLPLPCVSWPRPTTGRPPWPPDCWGRVTSGTHP